MVVLTFVFRWTVGQWSECSHTCGGGVSSRPVMCTQVVDHTEQDVLDDTMCLGQKPAFQRRCNGEECPPTWFTDEWSKVRQRSKVRTSGQS